MATQQIDTYNIETESLQFIQNSIQNIDKDNPRLILTSNIDEYMSEKYQENAINLTYKIKSVDMKNTIMDIIEELDTLCIFALNNPSEFNKNKTFRYLYLTLTYMFSHLVAQKTKYIKTIFFEDKHHNNKIDILIRLSIYFRHYSPHSSKSFYDSLLAVLFSRKFNANILSTVNYYICVYNDFLQSTQIDLCNLVFYKNVYYLMFLSNIFQIIINNKQMHDSNFELGTIEYEHSLYTLKINLQSQMLKIALDYANIFLQRAIQYKDKYYYTKIVLYRFTKDINNVISNHNYMKLQYVDQHRISLYLLNVLKYLKQYDIEYQSDLDNLAYVLSDLNHTYDNDNDNDNIENSSDVNLKPPTPNTINIKSETFLSGKSIVSDSPYLSKLLEEMHIVIQNLGEYNEYQVNTKNDFQEDHIDTNNSDDADIDYFIELKNHMTLYYTTHCPYFFSRYSIQNLFTSRKHGSFFNCNKYLMLNTQDYNNICAAMFSYLDITISNLIDDNIIHTTELPHLLGGIFFNDVSCVDIQIAMNMLLNLIQLDSTKIELLCNLLKKFEPIFIHDNINNNDDNNINTFVYTYDEKRNLVKYHYYVLVFAKVLAKYIIDNKIFLELSTLELKSYDIFEIVTNLNFLLLHINLYIVEQHEVLQNLHTHLFTDKEYSWFLILSYGVDFMNNFVTSCNNVDPKYLHVFDYLAWIDYLQNPILYAIKSSFVNGFDKYYLKKISKFDEDDDSDSVDSGDTVDTDNNSGNNSDNDLLVIDHHSSSMDGVLFRCNHIVEPDDNDTRNIITHYIPGEHSNSSLVLILYHNLIDKYVISSNNQDVYDSWNNNFTRYFDKQISQYHEIYTKLDTIQILLENDLRTITQNQIYEILEYIFYQLLHKNTRKKNSKQQQKHDRALDTIIELYVMLIFYTISQKYNIISDMVTEYILRNVCIINSDTKEFGKPTFQTCPKFKIYTKLLLQYLQMHAFTTPQILMLFPYITNLLHVDKKIRDDFKIVLEKTREFDILGLYIKLDIVEDDTFMVEVNDEEKLNPFVLHQRTSNVNDFNTAYDISANLKIDEEQEELDNMAYELIICRRILPRISTLDYSTNVCNWIQHNYNDYDRMLPIEYVDTDTKNQHLYTSEQQTNIYIHETTFKNYKTILKCFVQISANLLQQNDFDFITFIKLMKCYFIYLGHMIQYSMSDELIDILLQSIYSQIEILIVWHGIHANTTTLYAINYFDIMLLLEKYFNALLINYIYESIWQEKYIELFINNNFSFDHILKLEFYDKSFI